jgi:tryptophanyl-tRNA synthetase
MMRLADAPDHVDAVLANGAGRARAIAAPVMASVKDILGLVR